MYILSSAGADLVPWLPAAGAVFGLYLYYPLYKGIKSEGVVVNMATFVLWALLDIINAGSTMIEDWDANWQLPLAHAVGGACIIYAVWRTGEWKVGGREKIAAFFVVVSIGVWFSVSNESAIIASATGALIASVPMLLDWWEQPRTAPIAICAGMLLANGLGLSTLALGAPFDLEEHFYAAIGVMISGSYTFAAASRWLR